MTDIFYFILESFDQGVQVFDQRIKFKHCFNAKRFRTRSNRRVWYQSVFSMTSFAKQIAPCKCVFSGICRFQKPKSICPSKAWDRIWCNNERNVVEKKTVRMRGMTSVKVSRLLGDTFELPCEKTNKMACAPSENSDQPGHPPSLIRVFAVRMKKAWIPSDPLYAQRRLWSDWADAQADLSLRWAQSHLLGFVMRRFIFTTTAQLWSKSSFIKVHLAMFVKQSIKQFTKFA